MELLFVPNPFEMRGPEFLVLYVSVMVVAALACAFLWRAIRNSGNDAALPRLQLDPYETAYLAGGAKLAVDTAVAALVQRGVLAVDSSKRSIAVCANIPPCSHPFEWLVYRNTTREGSSIETIRSNSIREFEPLLVRLRTLGLIPSEDQARQATLVPALVMMTVTLFGAIKLFIGLSRGRPVGFLFVLCLISGIIALIFYKTRPNRTSLGDWFLAQTRKENAALEYTAKTQPAALAGADLAMAVGLFGIDSLAMADGPLRDLRTTLQPPPTSSSSSSSSSSSCSSGSSCGGGCGGGCGGCGG